MLPTHEVVNCCYYRVRDQLTDSEDVGGHDLSTHCCVRAFGDMSRTGRAFYGTTSEVMEAGEM